MLSIKVTSSLRGLPVELIRAVGELPRTRESHDHILSLTDIFSFVEVNSAVSSESNSKWPVRIGAWNLERCKYVGGAARVIAASGCDIVLLSEMDIGMARSGNRNTVRDLAAKLGYSYGFCAEFLEIGAGNQTEQISFADEECSVGLHGNAIISRFPLSQFSIIETSDKGQWYCLDWHHPRIGGRRALLADVRIGGKSLRLGSAHLESLSNGPSRAGEVEAILAGVDEGCTRPVVIGGDFNTRSVPYCSPAPIEMSWLPDASLFEPLFEVLARHGFDWIKANSCVPTRRTLENGLPVPPHRRMDWLVTRSLVATNPIVWPALNSRDFPISDHDLVSADLAVGQ